MAVGALVGGGLLFIPLVMKDGSDCLNQWRAKRTGAPAC